VFGEHLEVYLNLFFVFLGKASWFVAFCTLTFALWLS